MKLNISPYPDANTIGTTAGVASIDWGAAVQVMAAVSIGLDGTYTPTRAQLLYVIFANSQQENNKLTFISAVYAAIILTHAIICSLGTHVLARLQNIYIVMNLL